MQIYTIRILPQKLVSSMYDGPIKSEFPVGIRFRLNNPGFSSGLRFILLHPDLDLFVFIFFYGDILFGDKMRYANIGARYLKIGSQVARIPGFIGKLLSDPAEIDPAQGFL